MAETYEAIRKGPGDFTQRVCLKLVLPYFRDRQDFLSLFKREARLAAKLRHSNVVGVIDFGEVDGITYIALELVDGADLAAVLDAQPGSRLSHEHVAFVGHDIASALEHAHDPRREGSSDDPDNKAIIHRDLSPSNVLVSQRGEILLTDFGVAKAITGTARQQSAVKGKVPYMSPEQLRSEVVDGRADLFALGVVLYESLAGRRPFQGDHDPATIMQILNGDRRPLLEVAPETPPGLAEVIEQLLEPDREARPASASALLERLDPYVPSPRERRKLGKIVTETREYLLPRAADNLVSGSAPTESSAPAREESGVAATNGELASQGGGSTSSGTAPESSTPSRRLWALGALVLAAAIGTGLWLNRTEDAGGPASSTAVEEQATPAADPAATAEPKPPPTATTDVSVAAEQTGEPQDPPAAAEAPVAPEPAAEPVAHAPKRGRLSVKVFPWGDVWIDGKPRGRAPVRDIALPPGRHRVSAGQGEPSKTRAVRVKAGQRLDVQFDLSE